MPEPLADVTLTGRTTGTVSVQQTTADYLRGQLGWESVFAYNEETFGPTGTLGRLDDREIILSRYLRQALAKFNPGLPQTAYDDVVRTLTDYTAIQSTLQINKFCRSAVEFKRKFSGLIGNMEYNYFVFLMH